MATQDNQLDDFIVMALDCQAVVTPEQKAQAWDRVQRRARVSVQRVGPAPRPDAWRMIENCLGLLRHILLSEDIYHRAARERCIGGIGVSLAGDFNLHYYPHVHMNFPYNKRPALVACCE